MKLCLVIFIIILIYVLYILQNDESFYINYKTYYKPEPVKLTKAPAPAIWGNNPCDNFCPNMCLQSGNKYDQTGKNLDKKCYKYCKGNTSKRYPCV